MIDIDRVIEGTIAFAEAYRKMQGCEEDGQLERDIAVAQRIDDEYMLVNAFAGEFWAIGSVPDNNLAFWCDPDSGYTEEENFRDTLSEYLRLYGIQV